MTTAEERDAIEAEYERTLVCVKDCEAYQLKRQADDDLLASLESRIVAISPEDWAIVGQDFATVGGDLAKVLGSLPPFS